MYRTHFDVRRPLSKPIGLPRLLPRAPILSAEHAALLAEAKTVELIETDETTMPAAEDRENYYNDRHIEYWLSGLADWRKVRQLINSTMIPARYLDLGGSTGRVARHAARETDLETWVTDININWIDWIDKYFAYPIRAYQSRLSPTIPVADGYFSIISAFSVFTHFDGDERQWLLELLRVLRPKGYLYLTINDEHVWNLLKDPNWAWLLSAFSRGNDDARFAALVKSPLPGPRFIWEYSNAEGYNLNAFLSSAYIKKTWGRFATIVDYRVSGHNYQSVVVLQK